MCGIPAEMITASFLKCGRTNNLDGSQDELVIQMRTLMNLMILSSITYLHQSQILKVSLFKDTEHFEHKYTDIKANGSAVGRTI